MSIGARLREERERFKLAQTPFAELGGTTKQTQHAYESNRTTPKGSYLAKVAALGVDVVYVITGIRAENVAHNATELAYLRQCRVLATKGLAQQGLDGLNFLRTSNGIEWADMPAVYQSMNAGEQNGENGK
jgi:transcriptional regulator with XRE-family HTH domain